MGFAQLRSTFAVRPVALVSLELAPIVLDEEPDWVAAVLELLSVEGDVAAPGLVLGVAAVEPVAAPAAGVVLVSAAPAAGALPVLGAVVWAHAKPKVPAMAAAMTVMLNVR